MKKDLSSRMLEFNESPTLVLTAQAMQMQRQGIDVVSLTAGEPDFPTPAHIKQAAIRALERNYTHYTANNGIPELREAIADKFRRENDLHFTPDEIVVSTGAKAALYMALQALCSPGDEVLVQSPYYVSYPEMIRLAAAVPVIVEPGPGSGFRMDASQLRNACTAKTKAFILCSPSNPTGIVFSREELETFARVVHDTGIYVVTDEIYEKIIYDGVRHYSIGAFDAIRDQVVTINGASKAFAMTGWRIGYLGARREIARAAGKVQSQVTGNANSIAQHAVLAALTGSTDDMKMMVQEFERRRNYLTAEMGSIPDIHFDIPQGAFYLFIDVRKYLGTLRNGKQMKTSAEICSYLLDEHRIALVPGEAFGNDSCIRLSYACSMDTLKSAVERLKEGFSKLR